MHCGHVNATHAECEISLSCFTFCPAALCNCFSIRKKMRNELQEEAESVTQEIHKF